MRFPAARLRTRQSSELGGFVADDLNQHDRIVYELTRGLVRAPRVLRSRMEEYLVQFLFGK
jgi:hypothetical protein